MWIGFHADQFRAIIHNSDRMRSLLLAPDLFPMRCHVERDNNNFDETLEVLNGVKVENDNVGNLGGTYRLDNFSHYFQTYVLPLSIF